MVEMKLKKKEKRSPSPNRIKKIEEDEAKR